MFGGGKDPGKSEKNILSTYFLVILGQASVLRVHVPGHYIT